MSAKDEGSVAVSSDRVEGDRGVKTRSGEGGEVEGTAIDGERKNWKVEAASERYTHTHIYTHTHTDTHTHRHTDTHSPGR